jgi:hypothetical protein
MIRLAILLLAVAATACSDSAPDVGARFGNPSAITVFQGVTERRPEVSSYLAVANAGSDQLSIIDPRDDRPVQSPGLVFPLSVPTDGSPMFVAAASLADGGADALVVAGPPGVPDPTTGAQEVTLQLVATWDGKLRRIASHAVGSGGEIILAIAGVPVPQDVPVEGGIYPPVAGAARFLVALSSGRIAVVRATRQPADGAVALTNESSLALGGASPFAVVSLALSPDGRHVYGASYDIVTGSDGASTQGVAEIDTVGDDPAAWTVRGLSARAPTYGVAAARVIERGLEMSDVFNRAQLESGGRILVYALLDPGGCGTNRAIDCGVVTIDPAMGGLAEDPLGELPYRAPMPLPVTPMHLAAWDRAPAVGIEADVIGVPAGGGLPAIAVPGIRYTPGTGARATSALAVVTGADGRSYSLDLGRWGPGSDTSLLRAPTATSVDNVFLVTDPTVGGQIGMWNEPEPPAAGEEPAQPALDITPAGMAAQMLVTPGYTPDDSWVLGYQYPLSGLQARTSTLVRDASLGLVLAMQVPEQQNGTTLWRDVVALYAPQLGVHPGDVVELVVTGPGTLSETCAARGEARVASLLPPDPARWPGGALVLSPPVNPANREGEPSREDVYACWNAELPADTAHLGFGTVFAGEWVLVGNRFGYAGRPQPDVRYRVDYPDRTTEGFGEELLEAACAIPSWPPPTPVPACDADCRDACEQLAIVRKSRRFYYPQDDCLGTETGAEGCAVTGRPAIFDQSILVGPVIEFRFGLNPDTVNAAHPIVRAAHVSWNTSSGLAASYRAPNSGGQATGAVGFDRSPYTVAEPRIVFYLSYSGDAVYEAAYGAFATESKTIR